MVQQLLQEQLIRSLKKGQRTRGRNHYSCSKVSHPCWQRPEELSCVHIIVVIVNHVKKVTRKLVHVL